MASEVETYGTLELTDALALVLRPQAWSQPSLMLN